MTHILSGGAADGVILAVALASLLLTGLAFGAWRRTRNRKLAFVCAAFLCMALKGVLAFYTLRSGLLEMHDLELVHSLLDLEVVLLLLAPFALPA